jgi:predicted TIM-barrel fold metal-dependent hydrolase
VEAALEQGIWRGIGELHIFADQRHSPVFRRVVEIAAREGLPLQVHGDPAVIDTLYDIAPDLPVIWAHAGTHPCPGLIADYLRRYPALSVDLSVRDERIAPGGRLAAEWRDLFLDHPERFMVGVDTFSVRRWERFDAVADGIRAWLAQLPPDVAARLAYGNAAELFSTHRP